MAPDHGATQEYMLHSLCQSGGKSAPETFHGTPSVGGLLGCTLFSGVSLVLTPFSSYKDQWLRQTLIVLL